jgi:predicted nucleic acid-binding Zn ribbon protein
MKKSKRDKMVQVETGREDLSWTEFVICPICGQETRHPELRECYLCYRRWYERSSERKK